MRIVSERASALRAAALLLLCAAIGAGCTVPAEYPALDRADAAVERARSAPRVRALAPAELNLAEMALEQVRAAAGASAPQDQVEHLAYVVSQRAALAETRAAERVARSEIDGLQRALDQVLAHGRPDPSRHTRSPLRGKQQRRVLGQVGVEQDRQVAAPPPQRDQQGQPPQEENQQEHAPPEQDPQELPTVERDQQGHAWLEQDPGERLSVREDQQKHAPPEEDRQDLASTNEGQSSPGTESAVVTAIGEPVPEDIVLDLSELPFKGAEPTSDALEQLAALAERLIREPGPSVLIEADFDLPDPEARTIMERRVEVVRAVLVERGIAPARLLVRAGGDGPAEPRAPSSVEPAD